MLPVEGAGVAVAVEECEAVLEVLVATEAVGTVANCTIVGVNTFAVTAARTL